MKNVRKLALSGIIAAAYVALTLVCLPIAFGPVQFRPAEALTVIPFFFPLGTAALTVGCFLANLFSGYGVYDMVFGTFATLLAGLLTSLAGKAFRKEVKNGLRPMPKWYEYVFAVTPPIASNAFIIPLVFCLYAGAPFFTPEADVVYFPGVLEVGASEALTVVLIGVPLMIIFAKYGLFEKIFNYKRKDTNR